MDYNRCFVLSALIVLAVVGLCTSAGASAMLVSQGLGATAYSCRGYWEDGNGPCFVSNGFDGNPGTQWVDLNDGQWGSWIEVDLGYSMDLDSISLTCAQSGVRSIDIYVSDSPMLGAPSGLPAIQLIDQYVADSGTFTQAFPESTKGRHVMVAIVENVVDSWMGFYDVKVYGKSATITGNVTSGSSGPIAGATVATANGRWSTNTDGSGGYSLQVPSGDVALLAYADGFARGDASLSVAPDYAGVANMVLAPGGNGTVLGYVHKSLSLVRQLPIEGVTVSTLDGFHSTVTGADGSYSLSLPPGDYTLTASKSVLYDAYIPLSQPITVQASQTTSGVDFRLDSLQRGAIAGWVVSSEYTEIPGANVLVMRNAWPPSAYSLNVTTDPAGEYWVEVSAGAPYSDALATPYSVICSAPGYQTTYGNIAIPRSTEAMQDFMMNRGALASQNLGASAYTASEPAYDTWDPGFAFDGQFGDNRWIIGNNVGWVEADLGSSMTLSSVFILPGVVEDQIAIDVWVSDSPIGANPELPAVLASSFTGVLGIYNPVVLELNATPGRYVQVRVSQGYQWINIAEIQVFTEPAYISGTVRGTEAGNPALEGASVWTEDATARTLTDENGDYILAVSPGTHTITVGKAGYTKASATLLAESGQTTDQDFYLNPALMGTVTGHVEDSIAGEGGVAGVSITTSDLIYSAVTDEYGDYTMQAEAGPVTLTATKAGFASETASPTVIGGDTITQDFTLTSLVEGVITGTVLKNEAGLPAFAGATVHMSEISDWGASSKRYTTTTEADGSFRQRVAAGAYLVVAVADGYTPSSTFVGVTVGQTSTAQTLKPIARGALLSQGLDAAQYTASGYEWKMYSRMAFDGSFLFPDFWCIYSYTGWLQVDLGQVQGIDTLSWVNMGSSGVYGIEIWVSDLPIGDEVSAATNVSTFSQYVAQGETSNCWLPAGTTGRYLQIRFVGAPSWIMIMEAQVCGQGSLPYTSVSSIADLKDVADGTAVEIAEQQVVTVDSNTFIGGALYVENEDRTSAFKIVPAGGIPSVLVGDRVVLKGIVGTDELGERYLYTTSLSVVGPGDPLRPLGTINKSVSAAADSALSGLLGRTWGKVKLLGDGFVYIDDGSGVIDSTGNTGIRIVLNGLTLALTKQLTEGQNVAVTGIIAPAFTGTALVAAVHPRSDADIDIVDEQLPQ